MAHYVVYAHDGKGKLDLRLTLRDEHRARLAKGDQLVQVMTAGPLLDDEGKPVGSLLIIDAPDKASAEAFVAADPYTLADLYERVEVTPFTWTLGAPT